MFVTLSIFIMKKKLKAEYVFVIMKKKLKAEYVFVTCDRNALTLYVNYSFMKGTR